jgi:cell adhesion molecule, putative (fragment)
LLAPLSATLEPDYQAVDIGSKAVFRCLIAGYPIQTVIWLKNGHELKISERISLPSKEVLKIGSIQREDKGMYQCFVINEMETAQGSAQLYIGGWLECFNRS